MPSPIGHSLAGILLLILRRKLGHWREFLQYWREGVFFIFLAVLPDIDLFDPASKTFSLYSPHHHEATHTFAFAFLIALVVVFIRFAKQKRWSWGLGIWVFLTVSSHVLLDLFFSNTTELPGIPVFWPFLKKRIILPIHCYYYWERENILSFPNAINTLGEIGVGVLLIVLLLRWNRRQRNGDISTTAV